MNSDTALHLIMLILNIIALRTAIDLDILILKGYLKTQIIEKSFIGWLLNIWTFLTIVSIPSYVIYAFYNWSTL